MQKGIIQENPLEKKHTKKENKTKQKKEKNKTKQKKEELPSNRGFTTTMTSQKLTYELLK